MGKSVWPGLTGRGKKTLASIHPSITLSPIQLTLSSIQLTLSPVKPSSAYIKLKLSSN